MGDHRTNTLHYGQLGTATYLPDLQIWEFSRKIEREPALIFYGHFKCSLPASSAWSNIHESSAPLTSKKEEALLKVRPELAPGLGLLSRYEVSSRAITVAATKFDPNVSNLLAVGTAVNFNYRSCGRSAIPIAVLADADSATSIQLVELDEESVPWPPDGDRLCHVPTLRSRGKALWMATAGPVQQICFAETLDEKSTWLAVRFLQATIVFRPQYNKLPLSAHYDEMDFVRGGQEDTHLDANPILHVSISLTGGLPHADVTFNPWYQQQIAIVDRQGNWSVWDIGKPRQSTIWRADRGPSGSLGLQGTLQKDEHAQRDHYDGWAAVSWVGDVHKLLVCDRRTIALFRINTDPVQRHPVDVGIERESEWILDIRRSQSNLASIFVLTTTQVFWLHVNSEGFPSSSCEEENQEISVLLSWRHFRDPEDTSLRLVPLLVHNDFSLVLTSRLNSMAQVFRFSFSPDDPSIPVSVADPCLLPLPTSSSGDGKIPKQLSDSSYFLSMMFQQVTDSNIMDPINDNKTLKLVKFVGQRANMEVIESLYVARIDSEEGAYEPYSFTPQRRKSVRSEKWVDEDDFIVDDLNEMVLLPSFQRKIWNEKNKILPGQPLRAFPYSENWTGLYELAAAAVTCLKGSRGGLALNRAEKKGAYEPYSFTPQRRKSVRSEKWVDEDDFIVDDLNEMVLLPSFQRKIWNEKNKILPGQPLRAFPYSENWTGLYELAAAAVTCLKGSRGGLALNRAEKKGKSFDSWLENMSDHMGDWAVRDSESSPNSRTLLEILPSPPSLDDIDRNTNDFDQILRTFSDSAQTLLAGYRITCVPMPYSPSACVSVSDSNSAHETPASVTKLYDSLVHNWLFRLPGDVPNKIRMAKEKMIRNIVMQLILSRIIITRRPDVELSDSHHISESEDLYSYLPSSAPASIEPLPQSKNPTLTVTSSTGHTGLDTDSFLPTSSQAATTATTTDTTPTPGTSAQPQTLYSTLRLYTALKPQQPPTLPRRITSTLSHWKLGTDPSTYNWRAAVHRLREEEMEIESQSASLRRKRRERRRLQKQQSQSQQSLGVNVDSYAASSLVSGSQVPVVRMSGRQSQRVGQSQESGSLLGSGMGIGAPAVLSSQGMEEVDVPMTRVEKGLIGGRKAVKGRKKNRAAGF
ncbi:hypothetical protein PAAG_11088 [Paracoccidioides lutzii Pb01]|uniref:RNA polymerase I-specific transcription initiation factor RRN6-like protein n=1 Tax=Paracoccidioides lutzii (strain ATCC MYA-826 / Pb01) TaxID=502779 RepID=A0A0A2V751_PARBA|nr:hypothetical protein PAAG_11088 [Paracoccidioides lutzii Pb01]KGQ02137.1 hypothetical protein PAAG_11088 [Paracoccidioides lutzii Pb01]